MKEQFLASNRRGFLQVSLASVIVAAQPAILTGLLRASGGGGKPPGDSSDPYSCLPDPVDPYYYDTTLPDTTFEQTTLEQTYL
jgi:hypothetical protein